MDLREDPLLLAPDAGAVGPGGLSDAGVEEGAPVLTVEALESGHVVLDVEEAAGLGPVHDLIEGVGLRRGGVGVEGHVLGGEEVVVVRRIHAAGFVADVLICGAALLGGGGGGGVVLTDRGLGSDNEVGRGLGRGPFRGLERERERLKERCGSHGLIWSEIPPMYLIVLPPFILLLSTHLQIYVHNKILFHYKIILFFILL